MKRSLEKIFKVMFIIIVILALATPSAVLAQDVAPTDAPAASTEVVTTDVSTEAPTVDETTAPTDAATEVATEAATDTATEPATEAATDTETATEAATATEAVTETATPTETPTIDPTLTDVVNVLNSGNVSIADGSGDVLPMGSQEAVDVLATSDPFFWDGAKWVGYTDTLGSCPSFIATADCHKGATPFTAALAAVPANATVYVAQGNYNEDVTVATAGLSLAAFSAISGIAGSSTLSSYTQGLATVRSMVLNANFNATYGVYANSITVAPNGYLSDALSLINPNNVEATIAADVKIFDDGGGHIVTQDANHSSDTKYEWDCGEKDVMITIGKEKVYHMVLKRPLSTDVINYYDTPGNLDERGLGFTAQQRLNDLILAANMSEQSLDITGDGHGTFGVWSDTSEENIFWNLLGEDHTLYGTDRDIANDITSGLYDNQIAITQSLWFLWPTGTIAAHCEDWEGHYSDYSHGNCYGYGYHWVDAVTISPANTQLTFMKLPIPQTGGCTAGMDNYNGTCVKDYKISFCHATGSDSNPYTMPPADFSGLYSKSCVPEGHGTHSGDIIPPNPCNPVGQGDQTILANGCVIPAPAITVVKSVTSTGPYVSGSTISYKIVVTNTGNVDLTDVTVSDPNATISGTCSAATLAKNGGTFTCTASHEVSPTDIAAGLSYLNTATATGKYGGKDYSGKGSVPAKLDIRGCMTPTAINYNPKATIDDGSCIAPAPAIKVEKSIDTSLFSGPYVAGSTISYKIVVTNTGNVDLTDVTVLDSNATISGTCSAATLAKNGGTFTCTASHEVSPTDIAAGLSYLNTASATGKYLGKDYSGEGSISAKLDILGCMTPTAINYNPKATIDDESCIAPAPAIKVEKSIDTSLFSGPYVAGSTISYKIVVTNTGNVDLTDVTVLDSNATISGTCSAATLAKNGGTFTCTASHEVSPTDIAAGLSYLNTASATGKYLGKDYSGEGSISAKLDILGCMTPTAINYNPKATIDDGSCIAPAPAIKVEKSIDTSLFSGPYVAGSTISYKIVVTNTGNVDLTDVTVLDSNATISGTCSAATLAKNGGTFTCTASHEVSPTDIAAGLSYLNTASATGKYLGKDYSGEGSISAKLDILGCMTPTAINYNPKATIDDESCIAPAPAIKVEKSIDTSLFSGPYVAGSTISYKIVVTNTGNVDLTDVTVLDSNATISGTCSAATLAKNGGTFTCTASHEVSPTDIAAGLSYLNTASATGKYLGKDYSGEGSISAKLDILGCMDPAATNYNASATIPDGSCTYPIVPPAPTPALGVPVTGGTGGLIPVTGGTLIVSGLGHSCMTYSNGQVICWGLNASGQLGDGTTVNKSEPVYVKDLKGVLNLTAGSKHTCALTTSGEIWCWGENSSGQLGNGSTTNSSVPVKVTGLPGKVLSITAGEEFTCAQLMNQDVWCWGKNNLGQLNDGTTTDQTSPVKSKLTTMLAQISGGQGLLLGSDVLGSVNEWAKVQSAAVKQLQNSLSISANRWGDTGCAVASDGSVKCWGSDLTSSAVAGALPAMEVGTGLDHSCSINSDESVSCWGSNGNGQLGNGTNIDSTSATLVKNLALAHALAVGAHHTCVLSGAGNTALCWGENSFGQLGDNTSTNSNLPVIVVLPK